MSTTENQTELTPEQRLEKIAAECAVAAGSLRDLREMLPGDILPPAATAVFESIQTRILNIGTLAPVDEGEEG